MLNLGFNLRSQNMEPKFRHLLVLILFYYLSGSLNFNSDGDAQLTNFGCLAKRDFSFKEDIDLKKEETYISKGKKEISRIIGRYSIFPRGHAVRISLQNLTHAHCAGAIYNALYILTAAHCVDQVKLFQLIVTAAQGTNLEHNRSVILVEIYPDWNSKTFLNDLALLKLNDSLVLSGGHVNPFELGPPDLENASVTESWITGWGMQRPDFSKDRNLTWPEKVRQSRAPLIDLEVCNNIYHKIGKQIQENQICAGGLTDHGPCIADDGAPLVVVVTHTITELTKLYVVGILSTYEGCAVEVPDIYTKLENYKYWIESKAGYNEFYVHNILFHDKTLAEEPT